MAMFSLVVEGHTDAVVVNRLLDDFGIQAGPQYVMNGKSALDRKLSGYNKAAHYSPWLVLRDLNGDAECAPSLRQRLLPSPAPHIRLHIAVRAVEAWLLADAEAISRFLGIPKSTVPVNPESVPAPKMALVDLARRSRRRQVREAFVPAEGSTAKVGPGYNPSVVDFASGPWRPAVAERAAPSLRSLRAFLERLKE